VLKRRTRSNVNKISQYGTFKLIRLTGTSSLVPLNSPASVGNRVAVEAANIRTIVEVHSVIEPLSLAARLWVEADVNSASLAALHRTVGRSGDTRSREGESKETCGSELHFDGMWRIGIRKCIITSLLDWVVRDS
jgi:hypothetical protein